MFNPFCNIFNIAFYLKIYIFTGNENNSFISSIKMFDTINPSNSLCFSIVTVKIILFELRHIVLFKHFYLEATR